MTALPSVAHVRFGPEGVAEVESTARLTSTSRIYCHLYGDTAPALSVTDAHVRMSISVPDPDRVTAQDVALARELAAAVTRYIAELERLPTPRPRPDPTCTPNVPREHDACEGGAAGAGPSGRP
jgi:hypothetical protein